MHNKINLSTISTVFGYRIKGKENVLWKFLNKNNRNEIVYEKYNNDQILLPLLIMKVLQFPAFLLIICNVNILLYYTLGFEIRLIILLITGASFLCAGLFAVATFRRLEQEKLITKNYQIICSILSFLFLVDVDAVIYYYVKLRRKIQ